MTNTNAEFVFVGNTTYDHINDELETSKGTLRVGPVLDPHPGEYRPEWHGMNLIGMYQMCNKTSVPGEARIVKDLDGRRITLERALRIATPTIFDLLD
ncbi:MAG: hypothetical protein KJ955_00055 [Nanoarchaeota archaeon]|nr:hypothetical protein [Nanoarchaeota archaeon]